MLKGDISPEKARGSDSAYPPPHDAKLEGRKSWPLTRQWKLAQFGVNLVRLTHVDSDWVRPFRDQQLNIQGELRFGQQTAFA